MFIFFMFSVAGMAETSRPANTDVYSWLAGLGQVSVTNGGTALLPQNVLEAQSRGNISAFMQFIMAGHTMNSCIERVINNHPPRRVPYLAAQAHFNQALCILSNCLKQEILMLALPQMQLLNQSGNGQSTASMIAAFQNGTSCDNSSDNGIDPLLLTLLTQRR
jgi:hypothetical protein